MNLKNIKISSNRNFGVVFFIFFMIISLFSLFKDGNVRVFKCLSEDNRNYGEGFPWGYDDCCC